MIDALSGNPTPEVAITNDLLRMLFLRKTGSDSKKGSFIISLKIVMSIVSAILNLR
jgi:hypothetical protein